MCLLLGIVVSRVRSTDLYPTTGQGGSLLRQDKTGCPGGALSRGSAAGRGSEGGRGASRLSDRRGVLGILFACFSMKYLFCIAMFALLLAYGGR